MWKGLYSICENKILKDTEREKEVTDGGENSGPKDFVERLWAKPKVKRGRFIQRGSK